MQSLLNIWKNLSGWKTISPDNSWHRNCNMTLLRQEYQSVQKSLSWRPCEVMPMLAGYIEKPCSKKKIKNKNKIKQKIQIWPSGFGKSPGIWIYDNLYWSFWSRGHSYTQEGLWQSMLAWNRRYLGKIESFRFTVPFKGMIWNVALWKLPWWGTR